MGKNSNADGTFTYTIGVVVKNGLTVPVTVVQAEFLVTQAGAQVLDLGATLGAAASTLQSGQTATFGPFPIGPSKAADAVQVTVTYRSSLGTDKISRTVKIK